MYTMRAIREFKSDPIPDSVLRQILGAAGQAPSGGNRQPWKFIVVRSPEGKGWIADTMQASHDRQAAARAARGEASPPPTGSAAPAPDFPGLVRSAPAIVLINAIAPL